jgi:iron complex transport system substrate-binding protein
MVTTFLISSIISCRTSPQPVDFIDDLGRTITINQVPERVISFGPNITEILFALDFDENVVGVTDFCNYPPEAIEKASVGNAFNPSIENIVNLEPDLILTVKHQDLNNQLENLNIPFAVIDPKNIDGILKDIEMIGNIIGAEAEASKLISDIQNTIINITDKTKDVDTLRTFFIIDATDPNLPWTAGGNSFIDHLITLAGGNNIASQVIGEWIQFSVEEVLNADPEVIIIQTMAGGIPTVSIDTLEQHLAWQKTTAIRKGQVLFIDGDLVSRSGPRIALGLEELTKLIHPELF